MAFSEAQQKALSAKLSEKHVRQRRKGEMTLSYVEGWHVISEANRIFGFEGWDRETLEMVCVWQGQQQGDHLAAYHARVRLKVRAGEGAVLREGSGFGSGRGRTPAEAHESAIKEAETDATKRAFSTFGNPFGLALYDREQAGVRRLPKTPVKKRQSISLTIQDRNGVTLGTYESALEYCSALRRHLEQFESAAMLESFWAANQETARNLKTLEPRLKTGKGIHYADLLGQLQEKRGKELASNSPSGSSAIPPRPKRIRDKDHLKHVASQPCLICGRRPTQAHHLTFMQPRAMGLKTSDEWTVPLCNTHHRALHDAGNEQTFWQAQKIDPWETARKLWVETQDVKGLEVHREGVAAD